MRYNHRTARHTQLTPLRRIPRDLLSEKLAGDWRLQDRPTLIACSTTLSSSFLSKSYLATFLMNRIYFLGPLQHHESPKATTKQLSKKWPISTIIFQGKLLRCNVTFFFPRPICNAACIFYVISIAFAVIVH